jgi:hypothetical protein
MQQQHNNCKHLIPFPLLSNDVDVEDWSQEARSQEPRAEQEDPFLPESRPGQATGHRKGHPTFVLLKGYVF